MKLRMYSDAYTHFCCFSFFNILQISTDAYKLPMLFSFFVFALFLSPFIVNFPLIGASFPVLLFLILTGGLNKLTKAAQLCRNLPTLINGLLFFFPASHLNLPTSMNSYSSIFCCVFPSLMQLMYFLLSNSSFHIFSPLFRLPCPTFTSLCVCSLSPHSPIPSASPFDHAFHYSAASIDLLSGWSAIDYNTCSTATELRQCCWAKIVHAHEHPLISQTHHSSLCFLCFLPLSHIHFKTFGNTLHPHFIFSSSPLTPHLSIHRHIDCLGTAISSCAIPQPQFWNWLLESEWAGRAWHQKNSCSSSYWEFFLLQNKPLRCVSPCEFVCVRVFRGEEICWEPLISQAMNLCIYANVLSASAF